MITCRIVAYLIGLAAGYWVLTLADKQKNFTKTLGKVIAWVIIGVSVLGPLCLAYCGMKCPSGSSACPYMGHPCPMDKGGMSMDKGSMGESEKK